MITTVEEVVWQFLKKLNTELLYGATIPLLGIFLKIFKTYCPHKILSVNIQSNIIHTSQKVETNEISII